MSMKFRFVRDKVALALLQRGITARDLAKGAGISETSVYKAINGQTAPRVGTIKKICEVLGVDPSEVCDLQHED